MITEFSTRIFHHKAFKETKIRPQNIMYSTVCINCRFWSIEAKAPPNYTRYYGSCFQRLQPTPDPYDVDSKEGSYTFAEDWCDDYEPADIIRRSRRENRLLTTYLELCRRRHGVRVVEGMEHADKSNSGSRFLLLCDECRVKFRNTIKVLEDYLRDED